MRIFGQIQIPDELLEAQERNELVVFAGAGVSKESGFPDFKQLVEDVVDHFRAHSLDDPSLKEEQRLGTLDRNGKGVHRYVYDRFVKQASVSKLHKLSIRLFGKDQAVKIVTTNYDTLFTTVANERKHKDIQPYHAPALPPGNDFEGIVHVHGSVLTKPTDLVMTDTDFGRAYLTEGWARRFLVQMFNSHTVLFLGYRLNDTIVEYLSRALPPQSKKYVFSTSDKADQWRTKGVQPIITPTKESYVQIEKCLSEWTDAIHGGFIWVEDRIRSIVARSTTPDSREGEFILWALKNLATTRFFTKCAKSHDWLKWLNEQELIANLFDPYEKLTDAQREIAKWVAGRFTVEHYQYLLELIHKHGDKLNPDFWSFILWQVANNESEPSSKIRAIWITVLLNNVPNHSHYIHQLQYLPKKLKWSEDRYSILKLMGFLLEPIPVSEYSLPNVDGSTKEYKYDYRLTLRGEQYWLNEVWSGLSQKVGEFWREFLPTVEKYLTDAYQMNAVFDKSGGDQDVQSWWRSAIEKHEQDENNRRSFDVLIDAGRDILAHLLKTKGLRSEGRRLIESWFASGIPLLRRIAIHGVSIAQYWKSTKKIEWLLNKNLIHRTPYKHEVFQVIKAAIGGCEEGTVEKLVEQALPTEPLEVDADEAKSIREYEKYNLLEWMNRYAPESELIQKELNKVLDANPNYKPRKHPDLGHWTSGVHQVIPDSPHTRDELREMTMPKLVDLLITFKKRDPLDFRDQRRGLLETMLSVVVSDFEWSMRLALKLVDEKNQKSDVWYNLIKGWEKSRLSDEEWGVVIEFLSAHPSIHSNTDATCDLLENGAKKEEKIAEPVLTGMEQLADLVWSEISKSSGVDKSSEDWLSVAINNGAGKLGEFWIQALHKRFVLAGETWKGMPENYRVRFEEFLVSDSYAGQLIRVVLVSRIHYLYSHQQEWTREHLLPLLDYMKGELRAEQAWHGYLMWGRMPMNLFDDFKPLYSLAAKRLKDTDHNMREHLFKHIADIWLEDRNDPPDFDWFYSIISDTATTDDDREHVAFKLWHRIGQTEEGDKPMLWSRFLKKYWTDRKDDSSAPMSQEEADRIIEWTTWLVPVYAEAVELACQTTGFSLLQTSFFSDIERSKLPDEQPLEVIKLLTHVLKDSGDSTLQDWYLRPIYKRLAETEGVNEEDLKELRNIFLRMGVFKEE